MFRCPPLLRTLAFACAFGLVVVSCSYGSERLGSSDQTESVRGIYSAEQIGVQVDASGRPYDTHWVTHWPIDGVQREVLQDWSIPDGKLLVMDGNWIEIGPSSNREHAPVVDFDTEDLLLVAHWGVYSLPDGERVRAALGIEIRVPGSTVETWGTTEYGFSTDGGVGGVVTVRATDLDEGNRDSFIPYEDIDYESSLQIFDVVDGEGTDAVIFSLGGDGSYPLVRGYDADGVMVAAMVFDGIYPWRLMIPEGRPPPDISAIEEQYAECMRGERDVVLSDPYGVVGSDGYCDIDYDALPTVES